MPRTQSKPAVLKRYHLDHTPAPYWFMGIEEDDAALEHAVDVRVRADVPREVLVAHLRELADQVEATLFIEVDSRDYFRNDGRHTAEVRDLFSGFTLESECDETEDAARLRAMADRVERGMTLEAMEAAVEAEAEAGKEVAILRSAIEELRGVPLTPDQLAVLLRRGAQDLIDARDYLASPSDGSGSV